MVSRYTLQKLLSPISALLLPVIYFVIFNRSRGSTAPQSRPKNPRIRIIPPRLACTMAERYIPEHRRTQFKAKNTFKPEELRRRREEQQVEIRKAKREENLAKRRGIGTGENRPGASLGAAPDSDDDTAPTESQVRLARSIYRSAWTLRQCSFVSFSLLCPLRPSCLPSQTQEPLVCLACDGWWRGQRNYGPHTTDPTLALCGPSTASTSWYLWMGTPMQGIAEVVMRLALF